jgi:hypothetical protein
MAFVQEKTVVGGQLINTDQDPVVDRAQAGERFADLSQDP